MRSRDRDPALWDEACAARDETWIAELGAIRSALLEAGVAGPITFEVVAGYLRGLTAEAQAKLDTKVSKWMALREELLLAFGCPADSPLLKDLSKHQLDDRRTASWRLADFNASLLYTYEDVDTEQGEVLFGENTDYFVDNVVRVIGRAGGLVMVQANMGIGQNDLLVILSESTEVSVEDTKPPGGG